MPELAARPPAEVYTIRWVLWLNLKYSLAQFADSSPKIYMASKSSRFRRVGYKFGLVRSTQL